ncbi:hypothetical protein EDD11_001570 [Mortierella claussenii]|nr:hypothetical protein EDD11_001570 [Mortierella claussenii]
MASSTMLKIPVSASFLRSSLQKAITPFTATAPSESLLKASSDSAAVLLSTAARTSVMPSSTVSSFPPTTMTPTTTTTTTTTVVATTRSSFMVLKYRQRSSSSIFSFPSSSSFTMFAAPFPLWSAMAILCLALLSMSVMIEAVPAKHTPAPADLANAMSFSFSDTSELPLQLQIESRVKNRQQLAYLPTASTTKGDPVMDFYYLNYRPTYLAGQSKIDFWMFTPKGAQAPKTASLELYDEYGKVKLITLVPEGTAVPQEEANKNKPFLWKSWAVPKDLASDFDFSDKFRIVLKTAASAEQSAMVVKNEKRYDSFLEYFVRNSRTSSNTTPAVTRDKDRVLVSTGSVVDRVQDRQFRIKGLKATPGGKPNPAKLRINSVATASNKDSVDTSHDSSSSSSIGRVSSVSDNSRVSGTVGSFIPSGLSVATLVAVCSVAFFGL